MSAFLYIIKHESTKTDIVAPSVSDSNFIIVAMLEFSGKWRHFPAINRHKKVEVWGYLGFGD